MGFFHLGNKVAVTSVSGLSVDFLRKGGCKVCPLGKLHTQKHPQMEPTGVDEPLIYMLGTSPDVFADRKGKPFAGAVEKVLRQRLPDDIDKVTRWNNVVRTSPPDKDEVQRTPTDVEIECCRPSIVKDIEQSKPVAIFGFGGVALKWVTGFTGINKWRGRRVPVKVGNHTCWFFPFDHPQDILDKRRFAPRGDGYGSEQEFTFTLDLKRALDFVQLLDVEMPEPVVHTVEDVMNGVECVTGSKPADLERVLNFIADCHGKPTGFDYETNGLRPYIKGAKILTVAMSTRDGTMAFAWRHRQAGWSEDELRQIQDALEDWLYESEGRKLVHQLPFEMEWSAFFFGRDCLRAQPWGDSTSQAFVLDERMKMGKPDANSLEFLVMQYFGINLKAISNMDTKNLDASPLVEVLPYNGLDAKYHRLLHNAQNKRLKEEGLYELYLEHLERVATCVLTQMKGVPVDQTVVKAYAKRYNAELVAIEDKIDALEVAVKFKKLRGAAYRPAADGDVKFMMNKILGKNIEGTDKSILLKIKHPIAKLTLDWREPAKLLSTYIEPVTAGSPHIYADGCMHPIISTNRTDTSRTSSEDPNAQNWPIRKNRHIRKQVAGSAEERVVSFDYGSIQARNVAMESKDKALIQAFWDRYDIHADWTHKIVKLVPGWIDEGVKALANDPKLFKLYRNRAKNEFVFPSFFGAHPKSLSRYLGIDDKFTTQLQEEFWAMFPDIKGWHDEMIAFYYKHGYVTGLSGYRRRAPISPNQLINAPIQGDEAKIVLDCMTRLSKMTTSAELWAERAHRIKKRDDRFQANMEIHDDLTFIWPKKDVEKNSEVVIRQMLTTPYKWAHCVPLVVEMKVGKNWAEQEEVGDFSSDNWSGMDPNKGAWADGTGWANHKGMEKVLAS